MAGGKQNEGPANPSAVRIRDNQRRSRARHKEYVEGLQKKLQDYEKRGVEATLEMQQAARNVAVENSRLRILLGYHGVTSDDINNFLQTFPDQAAAEVAKATISRSSTSQHPNAAIAPKVPFQPLSRSPSAGPIRAEYVVPQFNNDTSTRDAVDAVVGITRGSQKLGPLATGISPRAVQVEPRQPLLQLRSQPLLLPALPPMVLVPTSRDNSTIDKLSVLATASAHQDSQTLRPQSCTGKPQIRNPPAAGQSPPISASATSSSRFQSVSPRSRQPSPNPPPTMPRNSVITHRPSTIESQLSKARLESDDPDET